MKKQISVLIMLVCFSCMTYAQSLNEIFEGNENLKSIFVNPLGITDAIDDTDIKSLESKANQLGLTYEIQSLGPFGEALSVTPSGFTIGGVEISQMIILINNDINMMFMNTFPSDGFKDFCSFLESNLSEFNKNMESKKIGIDDYRLYIVSDRYGIAVGSRAKNNTATAILMDMRNQEGFLNLGGLISKFFSKTSGSTHM